MVILLTASSQPLDFNTLYFICQTKKMLFLIKTINLSYSSFNFEIKQKSTATKIKRAKRKQKSAHLFGKRYNETFFGFLFIK